MGSPRIVALYCRTLITVLLPGIVVYVVYRSVEARVTVDDLVDVFMLARNHHLHRASLEDVLQEIWVAHVSRARGFQHRSDLMDVAEAHLVDFVPMRTLVE